MSKLKGKKYIVGVFIVIIVLGLIGLFTFGKIDKYKGLVNVNNAKLLSSVANTGPLSSKGTEEVKYNLTYTLDEVSGITKRDVVIRGVINSDYALFKEINKNKVTSTLNNGGKEIEINIEDVELGLEQSLEIPIQITNAPNGESIIPEIYIKEATGEEIRVVGQPITVNTNSVVGVVYDENTLPVSNIELSINKDGNEIKRTYTDEDGKYIFSDLETGSYIIKVEEEMYELVSGSETSESSDNNVISVKLVDKYNIETHKYIEKLNLVINGKKENYTYKDAEKVIQSIKNAKTIGGEIEYKLVVKNKGSKPTRVERIEDYPGEGLEFKITKNGGWQEENGKIIYKPLSGITLQSKETREVKIILDIKDTNEIKNYINKMTTRGKIEEKVVYVLDNRVVKEEKVAEGDIIDRPNIGVDDIDGWYTDKNYTNKYKFTNKVRKNLILYAKTKEVETKYTVNFIDKGNIIDTKEVLSGAVVDRINDPSKRGYDFVCWTLNNDCYEFSTPVTRDIDLTSKYEEITYRIDYELDGGELAEVNPPSYKITDLPITLNNPTKIGHTFLGWTGSNGNTPEDVTIPADTIGDLNYTANYKINKYTLTIDPKGGNYEGDLVIEKDFGSIITIGTPTKTGYTFTGWTLTGSGLYNDQSKLYTFGAGNGTLEANYELNNYGISYDYDSCQLTNEEITALNNKPSYTVEDDDFNLNNPSKTGYTFTGWTGTDIEEKTIDVTVDTSKAKELSYVANCTINKYSVEFYNMNMDNTYSIESTKNDVEYGTLITINDAPEVSLLGHTFRYWSLDKINEYDFSTPITNNVKLYAVYQINTYTIEYDGITDAERTSLNNPIEYTVKTPTFNLNNPANRLNIDNEGEVFVGWQEENDTTPSMTVTLPNEDNLGNKKYTAKWNRRNPDEFNIVYDLDDGELEEPNPTKYKRSELPIILNNPTKTGYTFIGWTGSNGDTPANVTIPTGTEGDLNYTANYRINKYNVDFYDMQLDGAYEKINDASIEKEYNQTINASEAPEVSLRGYQFKFWSLDKTNEYNFSTPVTDNVKLYAVYQIVNYRIDYELHDGVLDTGVTNPTSYNVNTPTFTLNNPSKTGYTFTGWTGTNGNVPETEVTVTNGLIGNLNYEANYEAVNYQITYNYDSCHLTNEEITTLGNRSSYTVEDTNFNLTNPSKTGYTFTGWTGTDLDEKTMSVTVDTSKAKELNFVANCTINNYSVEFYNMKADSTYEKLDSATLDKDYNETISGEEVPTASLRGYTFKFWSLDKATEYDLDTPITGNIKLYAVYQKDTYTISYDLDGGSLEEGKTNPETYQVDTEEFTLNEPSKTGYDFTGWTGSNGTNPLKNVTLPDSVLENKNYKANYKIKEFTVTYKDDEVVAYVDTVEYGENTTAPAENPTKDHGIFKWWSLTADGEEFNYQTPITSDLTLFAVYEEVIAPSITHSPTTWVKDKVNVTVFSEHPDYTYKYKDQNGIEHDYDEPFEVTKNCTVYATSVKDGIRSIESSHDITNIDKINPLINSIENTELAPESAKIYITTKDNESGMKNLKIYLNSVADENLVHTSDDYVDDLNEEKEYEYTITNLEQRTTYTIVVVAYDVVGNETVDTLEITTPSKHYVARVVGPTYDSPYDEQDESNYYETLAQALNSDTCKGASCVIQMLDDVEESNTVLVDQDIIIDLNGFDITGREDNAFVNNGVLTIIDRNIDEVGKVYSEGTAIINNGLLNIGENETELVVDANEPVIEGSLTGVNNLGELHFLDGKIIGSATSGAVRGPVDLTPYSYNASIKTEEGKEIASLKIIADAEARINSVYYTKAQAAVDESKNGTYSMPQGSAEIMSQLESKSDYKFVYDEVTGTLKNDNQLMHSTTSSSYIVFDLTNETNDKIISIDTTISSEANYDMGYVTINNTPNTPAYTDTNGRVILTSGTNVDNVNVLLEKGKKYYVHFSYSKNVPNVSAGDDTFTINNITLSDYDNSSATGDLKDKLVSDSSVHFFEKDGMYVSSNNSDLSYEVTNRDTLAHSYLKFDLTDSLTDKVLYVDALLLAENDNYQYISVTDSEEVPDYEDETVRQVYNNRYSTFNNKRYLYQINLKAGQVNYVHFCQEYFRWGSLFNIYSINLEDEVYKDHLNSDIHTDSTYYMYEVDHEPAIWKDLSGNDNDGILYHVTRDDVNNGFVFAGNDSTYVKVLGGITNTPLTKQSVEVEYSTTSTRNQVLYAGNSNERIVIGKYESGIIVALDNSSYMYSIPENYNDGSKHKFTVTYDEGTYDAYFDGVQMTQLSNTDYFQSNNDTIIGSQRNFGRNYFTGTIYSVKSYNRVLDASEITGTASDNGLLLYFDGTNYKKMLDNPAFINNNQYMQSTKADSYMIFDLTNIGSKTIYVNAEISSELNRDYGIVKVTNSANVPNNNGDGRYIYISGEVEATEYPVQLTGGRINYVHFMYDKDSTIDSGKDTFKINYIKYYTDSSNSVPVYIFSNSTTTKPLSPVVEFNEEVDTVELLRNVVQSNPLEVIETREVILDVRGYSLSSNTSDYVIKNSGNLTIIDSDYDEQNATADSKYGRELQDFTVEYNNKTNDQTEYYTNKQSEYDEEYESATAEQNNKKNESQAKYNQFISDYKDYMNSDEYSPKTVFNYVYDSNYQTFVAPYTGTYKIELWGAQGNDAGNDRAYGGKGGYTKGNITLQAGETLYVYVGEHRSDRNASFNAGSTGGNGLDPVNDGGICGYGGGGATDIRLSSGDWNDTSSLASRIMVAGGGGGASDYAYPADGGVGGGLTGGTGYNGHYPNQTELAGVSGGTQTTGGVIWSGVGSLGTFGVGGNGNASYGSAGGGGYYGGSGGAYASYSVNSGAGGSSFISGYEGAVAITSADDITPITGCTDGTTDVACSYHYSGKKFTSGVIKNGGESMPSYESSGNMVGNSGNGHARITFIDELPSKVYTDEDAEKEINDFKETYLYSGSYQEFVAPIEANYKIELWGASGGKNNWAGTYIDNAGKGGYSKGTIHLNKGDKLYVYVGEKGQDGQYGTASTLNKVSFNGGGASISSSDNNDSGGSGGGATDVRLVANNWDNQTSLASRIMVAGGGSGGATISTTFNQSSGGAGGGLTGTGSIFRYPGTEIIDHGYNATQTTGYSFGIGENGYAKNNAGGAGAGGGYFGGYSDTEAGGAGGGSGYISGHKGSVAIQADDNTNPKYGCDDGTEDIECSYHYSGKTFTDTTLKSGNDYIPTYDGLDYTIGNTGNGYAKITFADKDVYETPNEKYSDFKDSLNVTDYFDYTSYQNNKNWKNELNNNDAIVSGGISLEDNAVRVNAFDNRSYTKIPIDNTGDTIIYSLFKVNQNAENANGSRVFEIYSGLSFNYKTPMIYARYNTLCIDTYNRGSCSSTIDFSKYVMATMTINRTTNRARLYINGNYVTEVSFDDYGDTLYLSNSNNANAAEFGDNNYRMIAIGNTIPTDNEIKENTEKILRFYSGDIDNVVSKKQAKYESSNVYTDSDYITEGLQLYLDGKNPGDSPSTIWEDKSGNNNDATVSNVATSVAYSDAIKGYSIKNSGTPITIPSSPINATTGETVEVMFNVHRILNRYMLYAGCTNERIVIGVWDGQIIVSNQSSKYNTYELPKDINDGKVKFISVTYKDGEYELYYNGVKQDKLENTSYWDSNAITYIGSRRDGYQFDGNIYSVRVYDKALKYDEVIRNFNVDINKYNLPYNIIKREPTRDETTINGRVTNNNANTIFNEVGAILNIKNAVVEINKEGEYAAVENHGMMTMEDTGFINTLKRYNMGILNTGGGDILDGSGTITTYDANSHSIMNKSNIDTGFEGYKLASKNNTSRGITNKSGIDITIKGINISGEGHGVVEESNKKITIKNATIYTNVANSNIVQSLATENTNEIVIDNLTTNGTIINESYSKRKITVKNSTLETDKNRAQIINNSGTLNIDTVIFNACENEKTVENYNKADINKSTFEIAEGCTKMPYLLASGTNSDITIKKTKFKKHNTTTTSNDESGYSSITIGSLIKNNVGSNMTLEDVEFTTDSELTMAVQNLGANLTLVGETKINDNFYVGIANVPGWSYSRYNPTLTLGDNTDETVSTTYPIVKGKKYGLYTSPKNKADTNVDGKFNFYDGVLIGETEKALYSSVDLKPTNYDINVAIADTKETVTLKQENLSTDTNYVAQIGSTKYTTLQSAINAVPDTGVETEITIISDFATAAEVTIPSTKNVKINDNNHRIRSHNYNGYITNNGILKIYDSNSNPSKQIDSYNNYLIINNNELDYNNVTVNMLYNDNIPVKNTGTAVFNSGKLKTYYTAIENDGTLTINNGDYINTYKPNNADDLIINDEHGIATINDGYFYISGIKSVVRNLKDVFIHGGTFIFGNLDSHVIDNNPGATALIDGGTFDNTQKKYNETTSDGAYLVYNYGTATIKDITSKIGGIGMNYVKSVSGTKYIGDITVNNVTAESLNRASGGNIYSYLDNYGTANVKDSTLSSNYSYILNNSSDAELTVDNCTLTNKTRETGDIRGQNDKKMTIKNSTLNKESTGGAVVYLYHSNDVTIEDTNINSTYDGTTSSYSNGITIEYATNLKITGGSIKSQIGAGIYVYPNSDTVNLTIGTKGEPVSATIPEIEGTTYGVYSTNDNVVFNFYDGKITGPTDNAIKMKLHENEPGYDVVEEVTSTKQTKYNAIVPAFKILRYDSILDDYVEIDECDTLQEAFDTAVNGDILELQRELTILANATTSVNTNKTLTIDLNGKKIIVNNNPYINNGGDLTITDSKAIKNSKNIYTGTGTMESYSDNVINNSGTLTIERGNYTSEYKKLINNSGTVEINNGNFSITKAGNDDMIKNESTGTLTINNGYFYDHYNNIARGYDNNIINNEGTATIKGGIFEGFGYSYDYDERIVHVLNNSTRSSIGTVEGGIFNRKANYDGSSLMTVMQNKGTGIIRNIYSTYSRFANNIDNSSTNPELANSSELTISNVTIDQVYDDTQNEYTKMNYSYGTQIESTGHKVDIDNLTVKSGNYSPYVIRLQSGDNTVTNIDIGYEKDVENGINNDFTSSIILVDGINTELELDNSKLVTSACPFHMGGSSNVTIKNTDSTKDMIIKSVSKYDTLVRDGNYAVKDNSTGLLTIEAGKILAESAYTAIQVNFTEDYNNTNGSKNINIGVKDGTVHNYPEIKGNKFGIANPAIAKKNYSAIINFYDGYVIGEEAITDPIHDTETNKQIIKTIVDNKEKKYVGNADVIQNHNTGDFYSNLQDAIDDANLNDRLDLIGDITCVESDGTINIPSTKNITLNLNNHTIILGDQPFLNNEGTLIIDDLSDDKEGLIKGFDNRIINNSGTITFNKGTINCIRDYQDYIINTGVFNLNGGNIILYGTTIAETTAIRNSGTMNITDGSIKDTYINCNTSYGQTYPKLYLILNESTGTINVSGGSLGHKSFGSVIKNEGNLSVTGGDFTDTNCNITDVGIFRNYGTATISGYTMGSSDKKYNRIILQNESGTANVSNVTINSTGDLFRNFDTMNLNNLNINSGKTIYSEGGITSISGGTYEFGQAAEYGINVINSTLNINNNSLLNMSSTKQGIIMRYNSILNIENSDIVSDNSEAILDDETGSYFNSNNINIKSGSVTSNSTYGIRMREGNLVIGTSGGVPSQTVPSITGEQYGLYNEDGSIYFYDGEIRGKTGSIYGTITEFEQGYKEKNGNTDGYNVSTLEIISTDERVAVVNNVNFLSLQSAINYASNNHFPNIQLYKTLTLTEPLVLPDGGDPVTIFLGIYNINYSDPSFIDSGITISSGTAPTASISRFLANISGTEINPKNIIIFEMGDGSKLEANETFKLYKVLDGKEKIVKVIENDIGSYEIGSDTDILRTIDGKIYINGIGEGSYKLIGNNKQLQFTVSYEGVSNNIRENYSIKVNRTTNAIAELILQLQTGMVRSPFILIVMILIIAILGFIAVQKYKKEDYNE